jgi:predicted ferric reductase
MVFGCVAMALISFIFLFSLRPIIRITGYEFFRKSHYIVALLYIGACWGHWTRLACWMIASFGLFGLDRGLRLLRTLLIHFGKKDASKGIGFRSAVATITLHPDPEATVLILDFEFPHSAWKNGQHFFLTFPELSLWQSHPMTPASLPTNGRTQHHRYIIRARAGETGRLARLAAAKLQASEGSSITTPVILNGPYGATILPTSLPTAPTNILAIAGGTGISFALPIIQAAIASAKETGLSGAFHLVWVIHKTKNVSWIAQELASLRETLAEGKLELGIQIFVTRDTSASKMSTASSIAAVETEEMTFDGEKGLSTEKMMYGGEKGLSTDSTEESPSVSSLLSEMAGFSVEWLEDHHPHFDSSDGSGLVEQWLAHGAVHGGTNHVFVSGPAGMGRDLRVAVAARNDGGKVFKGDETSDVEFYWDDRFA